MSKIAEKHKFTVTVNSGKSWSNIKYHFVQGQTDIHMRSQIHPVLFQPSRTKLASKAQKITTVEEVLLSDDDVISESGDDMDNDPDWRSGLTPGFNIRAESRIRSKVREFNYPFHMLARYKNKIGY